MSARARRTLVLLTGLAASVLLSGCNDGMQDLHAWVAKVEARKAEKIPPIPKVTAYVPFEYRPDSQRDPFVSKEATKTAEATRKPVAKGPHPDFKRARQPLEQYPLDALHMVGTLNFGGAHYAMVSAPDGVIHRVSVGEYMGQNYGRIVKIEPNSIALSELVPNGFGGWQRRTAQLSEAGTDVEP